MRIRRAFGEQAQAAEIAGRGLGRGRATWRSTRDEPPSPPGADLTAAAFFDVDNTMMQGASIFHFARGLVARNFFTTGDLLRFALLQIKFRLDRRGRRGHLERPGGGAGVRRRAAGLRDRRARRGDLRRADGRQDLPAAPASWRSGTWTPGSGCGW